MVREFAGRNLAYVRELLGLPAKYASAEDAWNALPADAVLDQVPAPAGSVVYYAARRSANGNIAIAVGQGMVLTCSPEGLPRLFWEEDETLGIHRGWSWMLGEDDVHGGDHDD